MGVWISENLGFWSRISWSTGLDCRNGFHFYLTTLYDLSPCKVSLGSSIFTWNRSQPGVEPGVEVVQPGVEVELDNIGKATADMQGCYALIYIKGPCGPLIKGPQGYGLVFELRHVKVAVVKLF